MWYCTIDDQERGPFSELELRSLLDGRDIQPQTRVRRTDDPEWTPLELTSLAAALGLGANKRTRLGRCCYSGMRVPRADMCLVEGFPVAKDYRREAQAYVDGGAWLPTEVSGLRAKGNPDVGQVFIRIMILLGSAGLPAFFVILAVNVPLLCFLLAQPAAADRLAPLDQLVDTARAMGVITVEALSITGVLFLFSRHSRGARPGLRELLSGIKTLWGPVAGTLNVALLLLATGRLCLSLAKGSGEPTASGALLVLFSTSGTLALAGLLAVSAFAPVIIVDRSLPPLMAAKHSRVVCIPGLKTALPTVLLLSFAFTLGSALLFNIVRDQWPAVLRFPVPLQCAFFSLSLLPLHALWFCLYKELEAVHLARG